MELDDYAGRLTSGVGRIFRLLFTKRALHRMKEVTELSSPEDLEANISLAGRAEERLKGFIDEGVRLMNEIAETLKPLCKRFDVDLGSLSARPPTCFESLLNQLASLSDVISQCETTAEEASDRAAAAARNAQETGRLLAQATEKFYQAAKEAAQLRLRSWAAFHSLPTRPPESSETSRALFSAPASMHVAGVGRNAVANMQPLIEHSDEDSEETSEESESSYTLVSIPTPSPLPCSGE